MPDLANLNYAPLTVRPSKAEIAEFRASREVLGYDETRGFDEQKAPAVTGRPDGDLWERRFRFNAFAEANGMTYVFRSDPSRWPGHIKESCTMTDLLRGSTDDGRQFMVCAQEIVKDRGAVSGRDIETNYYAVVAVQVGAKTRTVFLNHKWRTHLDGPELLESNYSLYDPYRVGFEARDKNRDFDSAGQLLTPEVLGIILRNAPDYDLFLSGGWLYLMKHYGFASAVKKNADPQSLKTRFELAAKVGPALAAAAAEGPHKAPKRPAAPPSKADAEMDRRARAFVEKLMAEERAKNPDADQR